MQATLRKLKAVSGGPLSSTMKNYRLLSLTKSHVASAPLKNWVVFVQPTLGMKKKTTYCPII